MSIHEKTEDIILSAIGTFEYIASHLKAYSSLLERYLEREQSEMWDPYSPEVPKPEELDFDHHWGVAVFYPTTLRESLLVASFSHFESIMNELCVKIRQAQKLSVDLSDLKGRGVHRMRTYLIKVAGLSVPDPDWASVTFLNRLRNLIVHNNSQVHSSNKEHDWLRKTAEDWPMVEIPKDERIKFDAGFNEKAIDNFVGFFHNLRKNNTRYAA